MDVEEDYYRDMWHKEFLALIELGYTEQEALEILEHGVN